MTAVISGGAMRASIPMSILACAILLGGPVFGQGARNRDPAKDRLLAQLSATVLSTDFREAPHENVLRFLGGRTGVEITLSPEAASRLELNPLRLTLFLKGVTGRELLDILCHLFRLTWIEGDGAVLILPPEDSYRDVETCFHDLVALTRPHRWEPGPVRDLFAAFGQRSDPYPHIPLSGPSRGLQCDDVVYRIRRRLAQDTWDVDAMRTSLMRGCLVVTHCPRIQEEVRDFLAWLEGLNGPTVHFRVRVLHLSPDLLAGRIPGKPVGAKDWKRLTAAESEGGGKHGMEQALSVGNGERTHLLWGREFSFPRERYADGEIDNLTARAGLVLDVHPLWAGGDSVPCVFRFHLSRRDDTAGAFPRLPFFQVRSAVSLPLDRWTLVATGSMAPAGSGARKPAESMLGVFVRASASASHPKDFHPPWETQANGKTRTRIASKSAPLNFDGTPLREAAAFLAETGGVSVVLHPDLRDEFSEEELRIRLKTGKITLAKALSLICEPKGLGFWIRHGAVFVGIRETALGYAVRERAIPVLDLCLDPPEHLGTGFRGLLEVELGKEEESPQEEGGSYLPMDELEDWIRRTAASDSWDDHPCSISSLAGHMVLRNTPEVLDRCERALDALRARTWSPVTVEGVLLPRSLETKRFRGPALCPEDCDALEQTLAGAGPGLRFSLCGTPGRTMSASGGCQVVYARDRQEDGEYETDVLLDGWSFEARVSAGEGDRVIRLASRITGYRPAEGSDAGPGELETASFSTTVLVPPGGGGLLGALEAGKGKESRGFLYIRVR